MQRNATDTLAIKAARVKGWEPYKYETSDNGYIIVHGAVPLRISRTGRPVWATGPNRECVVAPFYHKVIVLSFARIKALETKLGTTLQARAKSIPLSRGNHGSAEVPAPTPTPVHMAPEVPATPADEENVVRPKVFGSFRTRGTARKE